MTENELKNLLAAVTPPDEAARAAAHAHWAALAKPLGGLGRLEAMGGDAAALTRDPIPVIAVWFIGSIIILVKRPNHERRS